MNILKEWLAKLKEMYRDMLREIAGQYPPKPPGAPGNPIPVPKPVKPRTEDK